MIKNSSGYSVEAEVPVISLVIPIYNEREVLPVCLPRLDKVMREVGFFFEAIFVDDGSKDDGYEYLVEQSRRYSWIRLVRLSRNFGKEAALTAGLDYAAGEAVVILDADLQDPPECIPKMVEAWRAGVDVVLMQRRTRCGESWVKCASSYLFYRLLNRLSDCEIPADVGDFRLMSRRCLQAVLELPERNRYMKGLFSWVGMPTEVIQYDRGARVAGKTKWNYAGLIGLAMEGITSFSIAPLRWAAVMGVFSAIFGGGFGLWIIFKAMVFGAQVAGYPSLIALITCLGGVQLITFGILGEYVGKTYLEAKRRPIYLVREVLSAVRGGEAASARGGCNARDH